VLVLDDGRDAWIKSVANKADPKPTRIRWILGTGFGLSDSDKYVVEQERLGPWARVIHPGSK
jgi:hypothetical protein